MFLFSSFQQNISVFAAVIFGKKWVTDWANKASRAIFASQSRNIGLL
jgi:hypothetical protein